MGGRGTQRTHRDVRLASQSLLSPSKRPLLRPGVQTGRAALWQEVIWSCLSPMSAWGLLAAALEDTEKNEVRAWSPENRKPARQFEDSGRHSPRGAAHPRLQP